MGLDMYLEKYVYVKNWNYMGPEDKHRVIVSKGGKELESPFPVKYVVYEVGYWRKANAIHKWFVDNCANGTDDCRPIYVDIEQLHKLLDLCKKVKEIATMTDGTLHAGTTYDLFAQVIQNYEDGQVVHNVDAVAKLLPTQSGFFFGGTDYDEWYMRDIDDTIEILTKALASDDEKMGEFYYQASW